MSPRGTPPVVHCCVCGKCHSSASPAVLYRSADRGWWCKDERACWARLDGLVAQARRAFIEVLAELEADEWNMLR